MHLQRGYCGVKNNDDDGKERKHLKSVYNFLMGFVF